MCHKNARSKGRQQCYSRSGGKDTGTRPIRKGRYGHVTKAKS